jgi:hypothetical protein
MREETIHTEDISQETEKPIHVVIAYNNEYQLPESKNGKDYHSPELGSIRICEKHGLLHLHINHVLWQCHCFVSTASSSFK